MKKSTKLRWVSWIQSGSDWRIVAWPPAEPILAYWCTGYTSDDDATVVALLLAKSSSDAANLITTLWSPGVGRFRFNRLYEESGPPGDRFPPPEWSLELNRWPWAKDGSQRKGAAP